MTREELKQKYSMRDIVERYGIHPNRSGFIHCPFHNGDKGASMKIYDRDYHCFGCGANGDIFSFVQGMEHCDFKTAYLILGGSYGESSTQAKLARYHAEKEQIMRQKKAMKEKRKKELNNMLIDIYRSYVQKSEPMSDIWCDCYNALQYQLYLHEILNEPR